MKVKYSYSKHNLESTINFISANNKNFLGQISLIRNSILDTINTMVLDFPNMYYCGTMGYIVVAEFLEEESMDSDNNIMFFNFLVDPSLNKDILSHDEANSDLFEDSISIE